MSSKPLEYSRPEKGDHLSTIRYEIEMLDFCYQNLVSNLGKWGDVRMAWVCLEAFLLHYRNLVEFFGREGDLKASEPGIWANRELTPEEVASISDRTLCNKYRGPISAYLQHCTKIRATRVEEINHSTGRKDRVSHGFKRDKSIVTNAREHRNRLYVFNVDLADFFPSINFGRVRGFFISDKNFSLDPRAAMVIARIACHENKLPQGSPCSPVISNLIAHVLDMHLVQLASKAGCTYSRYADDLTFSTNEKVFPVDIAQRTGPDSHVWVPSAKLREIVKHCGFQINPQKTNMQYRDSRQVVTGLVVNRKVNVRSDYRRNVRAMLHCLLNTGSFVTLDKEEGTLNQLHGMLGFIDGIDLGNKQRSAEEKEGNLSKKEQIYQRFLIYKNFFAAEAPVILCEGETDNVYLTHAIRRLTADYPDLAATNDKGKVQIKVRLYKYRDSSTARILGLRYGGSSSLNNFIATYKKETAKFKAPGQKHAVVILYDNDSGAKKIRNGIKQASGVTVAGNEPFVHAIGNLYAVPTPLLNGEIVAGMCWRCITRSRV